MRWAILACLSKPTIYARVLYLRKWVYMARVNELVLYGYQLRAFYVMGVIGSTSGYRVSERVGINPRGLRDYVRPLVRSGLISRRRDPISLYRMTELGRVEWERMNSLGMFEGMERECELARERLARRQARKGVRSIPLDRSNDNDLGV